MRRRLRALGVVGLAAILLWSFHIFWQAATVPPPEAPTAADAIVVLTGGEARVLAGLKQLADGRAPKLFISGAAEGVTVADIVAQAPDLDPNLLERIELGRAPNTAGNAAETASWAAANDVASVRLVTAYYHMPRSLILLREAAPAVAFWPTPVAPAAASRDGWWTSARGLALIGGEWLKYVATRLGYAR